MLVAGRRNHITGGREDDDDSVEILHERSVCAAAPDEAGRAVGNDDLRRRDVAQKAQRARRACVRSRLKNHEQVADFIHADFEEVK